MEIMFDILGNFWRNKNKFYVSLELTTDYS